MILSIFYGVIAFIFWFLPGIVASWILWMILAENILSNKELFDVKKNGFTLTQFIAVILFIVAYVSILILCWIPFVGIIMMYIELVEWGFDKFDDLYIIKPQSKK